MIVLDASVTLSWCFEDERTPATLAVLDTALATCAIVPPLWHWEVANALQMAVRRKRIDGSFRDQTLADLRALPIAVDPEAMACVWGATLVAADRFGLTVYDAAYLALAQRRAVPLATLDSALRQAAPACNVRLLGLASDAV